MEWNFAPDVIKAAQEIGIGDRVIAHWTEAECQDQEGTVVGVEIHRYGKVEYTVHLDGDQSPTDGFTHDIAGIGPGTIRLLSPPMDKPVANMADHIPEAGKMVLAPCPFCGGEANAYVMAGDAVVECTACGAELSQGVEDDEYHDTGPIIARWNRRPQPSLEGEVTETAEEERDALLRALGFKPGPMGSSREVILKDAAGLRPEMVRARTAERELRSDRDWDRMAAAELLRKWVKRKFGRWITWRTAWAAVDEIRPESQALSEGEQT